MKMELSFRDIQVVYRKAGKRKQGDEEMGKQMINTNYNGRQV